MKIELGKHYGMSDDVKRGEAPWRCIATDRKCAQGFNCVLMNNKTGAITQCNKDGRGGFMEQIFFELSPYHDFKRDDPVMVRDINDDPWERRYFSHVDEDGFANAFVNGATSWSVDKVKTISWLQCRRPTSEELAYPENEGVLPK